MKLWQALALITLVWAGLYLPYLGSQELRGEEARRILPGRTMIETGDWVVARIGGEVYNRKPPLINWCIAASFIVTGVENEWTARLPSVLWLLAFSVAALLLLKKRFGIWRAACVPLFFLSTLGMLDKGRMAEIEAMYIAQFGIAFVMWAVWWAEGKKWLAYVGSGLFLGIAMLAKGPVHLMFWYPILLFALWRARALKELIHPAHLVGVVLTYGIFLPWLLANVSQVGSSEETSGVWWQQLSERVSYVNIDWKSWLEHPFQIVINFLPWSILLIWCWWRLTPGKMSDRVRAGFQKVARLPLIGKLFRLLPSEPAVAEGELENVRSAPREDRWAAVIRGSQFGILLGVGLLLITPEGLPRYTMPLFGPASVLLVDLLGRMPRSSIQWAEGYWRKANLLFVLFFIGMAVIAPFGVAMAGYPIFIPGILLSLIVIGAAFYYLRQHPEWPPLVGSSIALAAGLTVVLTFLSPIKETREKYRPDGQEMMAATPDIDRPLTIFAPKHIRFLFYVKRPYEEVGSRGPLPERSGYFIMREKDLDRQSIERYFKLFDRTEIGRWTWEGKDFVVYDLELKEPRPDSP